MKRKGDKEQMITFAQTIISVMAFDELIANQLREAFLIKNVEIEEKRMFGGIALMYKGKMCCGVVNDELMTRVVEEKMEQVLSEPYIREMDFTGKPLKGFVYVGKEALKTNSDFSKWIDLGMEHVNRQLEK